MDIRVFNIQKFSIYDGPGIRTLVFFQGCPLNCLWCANPEGKKPNSRLLVKHSLCSYCGKCEATCPNGAHKISGKEGRHEFFASKCEACGKCVDACPQAAICMSGRRYSEQEILDEVLADEMFYRVSGGGLTLGGGEPLAQPAAAASLLKAAKARNLRTAMETCGYATQEALTSVADFTDMFLFDIKHMDSGRHKALTGRENGPILRNFAWLLDNGHNVKARMPLISGCNTEKEEMERRARFLSQWKGSPNFHGIDLLPYHKLGIHKYAQLGEEYSLDENASVPEDFLAEASAVFQNAGLTVSIVRH